MINVIKSELPDIKLYFKYLKKIWKNNWVTNNGEFLQLLEKKLETHLKVKHVLAVTNGTLAIQLALRALDLRGEVITTPYTFAATTNSIIWEGLTPVFADIDRATFNLDPRSVERQITKKTSAILAVHVYGNSCDNTELRKIADKYNLKLIYDAAHAFGVELNGRSILGFGDLSALSFHATKTFHTVEGGAIVSNDTKLHEKMVLLRDFGIQSEEKIVLPGINAKMNEFQAAMGLCNFDGLEKNRAKRKLIYEKYKNLLGVNNAINFQKLTVSKYNYSYMPVYFVNKKIRDGVFNTLLNHGVKARKYFYPLTCDFEFFKTRGENLVQKYKLENAKFISDRILCLPIYPSLELQDVEKISKIIHDFLSQ
jgi:dTDP-4-amino-4,6-dideoxygalactose transaminase